MSSEQDVVIAVHSYGSQRVKNRLGRMVSAYKIGYSSAARDVLLAMYGDQAEDISSSRASYYYIQINREANAVIRLGYLLLKVTPEQVRIAEAITKKFHRPAVYRWHEDQWMEFPYKDQPDYKKTLNRGPSFNPTGMLVVSATTGETEAAIAGITVEVNQRTPQDMPWHWISGDTYEHRDLLTRHGCRWSRKRKAWFYIGTHLPEAIQNLIDANVPPASSELTPFEDDPEIMAEVEKALGVHIKPKPTPIAKPTKRLFKLNERVYARYATETANGTSIPYGTQGKITRLYERHPKQGWSYDVEFEGVGVGWFFENELTSSAPIPGITITTGPVVPPGAVLPATMAEQRRALIEQDSQPKALGQSRLEAHEPGIVITESQIDEGADDIAAAVKAMQFTSASLSYHPIENEASAINFYQEYVGEIAGSITGNVYCYGYAIADGKVIYLNLGGPSMATQAIRAKLGMGESVQLHHKAGRTVELTADSEAGQYVDYNSNIAEARFLSLILLHNLMVEPKFNGKFTTAILHLTVRQAKMRLFELVEELVDCPIFEQWIPYLWEAGNKASLVRNAIHEGGPRCSTVNLDRDAWTRLIAGGLEKRVITLPEVSHG